MYLFYNIFFAIFISSSFQNVVDMCDSYQVCVEDGNENDIQPYHSKDNQKGRSVCSDWCKSGLNWTVLNSTSGRVLFRLHSSPTRCEHTEYHVQLETYEEETEVQNYEHVHSRQIVQRCYENCTANCKPYIEFEIPYVFSGKYRLNIQPFVNVASHQACFTEPFYVQTKYQKLLLSYLTPNATQAYQSQSEELRFSSDFGEFHFENSPKCAIVKLKSTFGLEFGNSFSSNSPYSACCSVGKDHGYCCDLLFPSDCKGRYEIECACSFNDASTLRCTFHNIIPGNYSIVLSLHDPRCAPLTLWADDQIEPCTWHLEADLNGSKTPLEVKIDPKKKMLSTYSAIIIFALVCTFFIMIVLYKPNLLRRVYKRTADSSNRGNLPHYEFVVQQTDDKYLEPAKKLKIVLLYPRDCEEFMNVMSHFRIVLGELTHAEIFDPWDDDLYEQVAQSPTSWSNQYIIDYDVKIILVLSKCSKIFEDAVISKKHTVEYIERHSFDVVFPQSLDAIHSTLHRYKRVFVIRFDENDLGASKFDFINSFVVYNLPQSLGTLVCDLHSVPTGTIVHALEESPQYMKFLESIKKYKTFKETYVDYLNYLLR